MIKDLVKRAIETVKGRYFIKKDIELSYILIGNSNADSCMVYGEYFDKERPNEKKIIYSAGIGNEINFERGVIEFLENRGGCDLYAIDPTPQSIAYLKSQDLPANFHVLPYALSHKDEELLFALPSAEGWISGSAENVKDDARKFDFNNKIRVEGRTIKSIMMENGHKWIDLLKLDIEGSEFSVLEEALKDGVDIRAICVDHHEHMFENGNDKLVRLINTIHKYGYKIFYVEQNVSKARSFSCIRTDYI